MSVSKYVTLCATIQSELLAALAGPYSGLVLSMRRFKADRLPDLSNTSYAVIISPPPVWNEERKVSTRSVQQIFSVDLYFLVKNFDETKALYGTSAGQLGLFQLVEDAKAALYASINGGALNPLLSQSFTEVGGKGRFDEAAVAGFDSGEYPFWFRAVVPFMGGEKDPTCF